MQPPTVAFPWENIALVLTGNFVLTVISRIIPHEPRGGAGTGAGSRATCTEPSWAFAWKVCSVASESPGIPEPILLGE